MKAQPATGSFVLKMAETLGKRGFRVVRVYEGDKRPVGMDWPRLATADVPELTSQFSAGEFNIGVACGPQPNNKNLVVVDVDVKHDGLAKWQAIVDKYGPFPRTATHRTPSGGLHFFWDSPDTFPNGKLTEGIDIRGDGGQVVVPPSWRLIDGERVFYAEEWKLSGIHRFPLAVLPGELWEMLQRPVQVELVTRPAVNGNGPQRNEDWLRDHWDWVGVLEGQGHTAVKQHGRDVYMRHPSATAEHSAVVHLDANMMNAFSTNMPVHPRGLVNRDGSVPWSPFDWFVATEFNYDVAAAHREIDHRRGFSQRGGPPVAGRAAAVAPDFDDTPGDNESSWRLPVVNEAYWSASARNQHIFLAARAAMVSPDALDLVMFALQSTLIPPGYLLPRIVGGQQPLNMLACLVAPTGMFKTSTLDAARDLMGPPPPWVVQIGMGSGEGIGATFLEDEMEVNAKSGKQQKTGRLRRNKIKAAFFEADEGSGLTEQAGRAGATVIANLCKAWSGSTLGEANADPAKRRHVLDRDYRIAALVNIQPSNFAGLFSIANTGTGLTGRFMFSGTADYDIPDTDTEWPGVLEHPSFPDMPLTLEIAPSIIAEAKASIRERHRTASLTEANGKVGQNAAVVARLAGIAVLCDDRRAITEDDWELARMRVSASMGCLDTLDAWFSTVRSDADHTALKAKGRAAATIETEAERAKIGQTTDRILTVLAAGPMSAGNITAKLAPSMRDFRDLALDALVALGKVRLVGERWECL